jgi:hypothetical protein
MTLEKSFDAYKSMSLILQTSLPQVTSSSSVVSAFYWLMYEKYPAFNLFPQSFVFDFSPAISST